MYNYGIRGAAYKWFVSYLSNREQYTPCFIKTTSLIAHNFGKCWQIFKIFHPWTQQWLCNELIIKDLITT